MRTIPRLLIVLTLGIGGGSLVLLGYFLSAGKPFRIPVAQSETGRLAVDSLLCLVFFVQHSGMVRRGAKRRIARYVPASHIPALYSIASGIALLILVLLWQPTDRILYSVHGVARWLLAGISVAAVAGFVWGVTALGEFDPFGTAPLRASLHGAQRPGSLFVVRGPYRFIRHPLYLFVLILLWDTSRLSTDRLLFNVLWTAWIVVATTLEERDLRGEFGQSYRQYQQSIPMLIPLPKFLRGHGQGAAQRS